MMNTIQRERLLQLIKQHFPNGNTNRFDNTDKWENIVQILNELGPERSVDQWQKMWKDIKSSVKTKLDLARSHRNTSGLPADLVFSEEDKLVILICGVNGLDAHPDDVDRCFGSIELLRQLDCGAVSPFDSSTNDDDELKSGGLIPDPNTLEIQKQMVDLLKNQNDTVNKVLEQQKETNKFLNQIVEDKSKNNSALEEQLEEQKQINFRLVELMAMLQTHS